MRGFLLELRCPFGDAMNLDNVVDLVKVDLVLAQTSFTLASDYLHSLDFSFFTWTLIYSDFLGVLHVLLYSFIHKT